MKTMNTRTWMLVAALAAAPLTVGTALAQDTAPGGGVHGHEGPRGHGGPHHGGRGFGGPGQRIEMLTAILGLDAHQEAGIRQIFEANRPRREQIRAMTDQTARHAAMEALHHETRASIDALLNPDQRATLDRMEAARRAHGPRGEGREGGRGHGHGSPPSAPPTGI